MNKDSKPIVLQKPIFIKIAEVKPGRHCYHVYGKVIKVNFTETTRMSGDKVRIADGIVGDETGTAAFHFEGPAVDQLSVGAVIAIRNGRSDVVDEHISLQVDKFGKVTKEDASLVKSVDETPAKNISAIEYQKVQNKDRR